jgi:hypothetical protein
VDSLEVSVETAEGAHGPEWKVLVQRFDGDEQSLWGSREFGGQGVSMSEDDWVAIVGSTTAQLTSMLMGRVMMHCVVHEIIWCEECGLARYEPGPFD